MEILIFWLLMGVVSSVVMSQKGRSSCAGFLLGVLLGPIGLIIALVLKKDQEQINRAEWQDGKVRQCPQCAEYIKSEARKCRFCGSEVPPIR